MRRREFLKASTVGAGVALLQACRQREEERFLVQVPERRGVLQGETIWRPSVCRQCSAGCGIQVRVVDGDAKKIEGSPNHPVNHGGVCSLGHSLLQEVYNPDRIGAPQRRSGERGRGSFQPTSWDEALAAVVDAISAAPGERLAFVGSDRSGLTAALLRRLTDSLDAPPPAFLQPPDLDVERAGARIALGVDDVPYFDVSRSDYVLSIGSPMVDRWRSPVHYTWALAEMRRGRPGRRGRLVQAEERMSLTAANADEWLPLRPGTGGVLARAVAGVLLSEGVDETARARYARLFPDEPPTLEDAAVICDLDPERILRVARELHEADNRLVMAGGSEAVHTNGLFNVVAAHGLNLLLDNLGRPGGVFAPVRFDLAQGIRPADVGETSMAELVARLRGESGPAVEVLCVVDVDPVHALPASWGLADALGEVGTVVALSSFTDDTTLHADVVLPMNTELERFNAVEPSAAVGVRVLGLAQPVIDPLGEAHHPADVLLAMAMALGGPVADRFPWSSFEDLVRSRIEEEQSRLPGGADANPASYYFDALARGSIFEAGEPEGVPPGPGGPAPSASESRTEGSAEDFPFQLLPYPSLKMAEGQGANRPWLQELPDPMSTVMWNSWAELSPADAERLGIRDGDRLLVESPSGSVEVHAVLDPTVRPGTLGMPLGQGHTDYGRYARGRGVDPVDLVGRLQVDGTAASARASARVRIERLEPGELARFGRSYTERGEGELIPVGWAPQETVGREVEG